jgi:hypothetical protein
MRKFLTEDGCTFHLQPDGSHTDNPDPDEADTRMTIWSHSMHLRQTDPTDGIHVDDFAFTVRSVYEGCRS